MGMNMENYAGFMVPRADFKVESFDTLIKQKGYRVVWEQAMFCSCYNLETGQPRDVCPTCKGKGYIYFDPVETRSLVTSISGRKEQEHIGLNEMGTAYLTPLSTDNVGFRDRFRFMDFTMKHSQLMRRSELSYDTPTYDIRNVISVRKLDRILHQGIHFELSKNGKEIQWKPGVLEVGDMYSILYDTIAVYICMGPIHELRGTYTMHKTTVEKFVQLPKQFQIKREDFVDADTPEPGYRPPFMG